MAKVKYEARYGKKKANPFALRVSGISSITVEIDESVPIERVKEMAREATPDTHEFIEVKRVVRSQG